MLDIYLYKNRVKYIQMEKIIQNITKNVINEIYNQYDKRLKKVLNADKYNDKKSFLKYAKKRLKEKGKRDPSTEFQFIRYVDNEWCVHFCDKNEAISIAKNGFKYGTPQVTKIPYSFGRKGRKKGYNYAFLASDICSGGKDTDFTRFWGYDSVIFKCSGVLGFHRGDENRQVVFWGESAKNIIPIIGGFDSKNGHFCQLLSKEGKVLYKFNLHNFDKVLNWLINNEFQYRKKLLNETWTPKNSELKSHMKNLNNMDYETLLKVASIYWVQYLDYLQAVAPELYEEHENELIDACERNIDYSLTFFIKKYNLPLDKRFGYYVKKIIAQNPNAYKEEADVTYP